MSNPSKVIYLQESLRAEIESVVITEVNNFLHWLNSDGSYVFQSGTTANLETLTENFRLNLSIKLEPFPNAIRDYAQEPKAKDAKEIEALRQMIDKFKAGKVAGNSLVE